MAVKHKFEARAGKHKCGTRTVKYKLEARAGKHKLVARAGKYKFGARAVEQGRKAGLGKETGKYKYPKKVSLYFFIQQ